MRGLLEIGGKRVPFLRWSFIRMGLSMRTLLRTWQVGDGREEGLARYVTANARRGDADDVIRVIDEYCYTRSFMINVGDEKGVILDAMVAREKPKLMLELGAYVGYSALRIARLLPPGGHLVSVEPEQSNWPAPFQLKMTLFPGPGGS